MDAYVLGSHPGELPTHLLSAEPGNRIRAVARLEDGEYDVFYALETQSEEDVERHLAAIREAGTDPLVVWHTHGSGAVALGPIPWPKPLPPPPPAPAWVPPCDWYLFLVAKVGDVLGLVEALRHRFGPENVAVVQGPDGRHLLEVGSKDRDELATALDELGPLAEVSGASVHFSSGVQRR